ncbi:hypothetical protein [Sphingomonas bacterium]|uniref:hypothetical protein n=1 Tax=Sphingomonas bacterium TaxID=1895847 RepID=UPI0020C6B24D|nr:hypothetical protein [Sphingomonas bacterium]
MQVTAERIGRAAVLAAALGVSACAGRGELDSSGTGIATVRSACPSVGVPAGTGDVTLFDPAGRRDADALDLSATMTNVRSTCTDQGDQILTGVTFDVQARRQRTGAPRDVTLPFFIAVVRGGSAVVAKRVSQVTLHFDAGSTRAQGPGTASTLVTRTAATLPDAIRRQITRKRKAGDEDAAVDPLTQPEVRAAVLRTSFEALVGFQLTDEQLKYNATR